MRYIVRYYDRKLSHKGQGTQARAFSDPEQAAEFASRNRLYGRPCKVEVDDNDTPPDANQQSR